MLVKEYLDITKGHYGINIDNQGFGNYTTKELYREIKDVKLTLGLNICIIITTVKEKEDEESVRD